MQSLAHTPRTFGRRQPAANVQALRNDRQRQTSRDPETQDKLAELIAFAHERNRIHEENRLDIPDPEAEESMEAWQKRTRWR